MDTNFIKSPKTRKVPKGYINVVDTVPIPVGMYRTGKYTGIETPTVRTSLNTSHIPAILADFG